MVATVTVLELFNSLDGDFDQFAWACRFMLQVTVEDSRISLVNCIAAAVAASWVMLVVGRRWRCEASWIDRGGRLIGCYWLGMAGFCSAFGIAAFIRDNGQFLR